jgi:hypothetical protein
MEIGFLKHYGGQRVERNLPFSSLSNDGGEQADDTTEPKPIVNFDLEVPREQWIERNPLLPLAWNTRDWANRPIRFVDGKDVGQTVAWLRGRDYPVPVRLAEIGGVSMRVVDEELRREYAEVRRVVAMDTSPFPWDEIEDFAIALRRREIYLLPTSQPKQKLGYDFDVLEYLTNATWRRTSYEMGLLEELAVAQNNDAPTVVDGPLKTHEGGFDTLRSPIFGVIKSQRHTYLHPQGQMMLYDLRPGRRTPAFSFQYDTSSGAERNKARLPVVSWYMRLAEEDDAAMPSLGIVRIEVSYKWFEAQGYLSPTGSDKAEVNGLGQAFIDQLTRTVFEYRCRERSYRRAANSLHPIVRAEESLGALFSPGNRLKQEFYRLTGL